MIPPNSWSNECFREKHNANYSTFVSTTVLTYESQGEPLAIATRHQDQGNCVELEELGSNCIFSFFNHIPCNLPKFSNCFKIPSLPTCRWSTEALTVREHCSPTPSADGPAFPSVTAPASGNVTEVNDQKKNQNDKDTQNTSHNSVLASTDVSLLS